MCLSLLCIVRIIRVLYSMMERFVGGLFSVSDCLWSGMMMFTVIVAIAATLTTLARLLAIMLEYLCFMLDLLF